MNPRAVRRASPAPVPAPAPLIAGPTPELPIHSEDGVDLTLIRWMLSLTPAERLDSLEGWVDGIRELRGEGD
jgi:hypothetical protein